MNYKIEEQFDWYKRKWGYLVSTLDEDGHSIGASGIVFSKKEANRILKELEWLDKEHEEKHLSIG